MKRSEINKIMKDAAAFLNEHQFLLPPFAYFTPEEWKEKNHEYDEIRRNCLGWDITDFGSGDFHKCGLFLFTLRNGNMHNKNDLKVYAEKIMIVEENQTTPYHYHWYKQEDIINRGGGNLMIRVYAADKDDNLSTEDCEIQVDGRHYTVPAGTIIRLTPGMSLTNTKKLYHAFWGEPGHGKVLVGEVSQCNDDSTDNRFFEPFDHCPYISEIKDADTSDKQRFSDKVGRFPEIEEDEKPWHLLCNEYPEYKA
ncbi:MAG: D-lyxose/D-mannose family sugar isomerase [Clostridia bacterium]|nr:D-lyxose/D-mannose family sugar isomerase [Clostridia bacterium]MBQ3927397.1 D-lyxose/D-mannose family sugar isomerase [Clostridia bacterium]